MGTLTCTSTYKPDGTKVNNYTCTGLFCARKIGRLKTQDAASAIIPTGEFKVLQIPQEEDDIVLIGLRSYPVNEFDIIIAEFEDDVVEAIVFKGDDIVFRSKRPKETIRYLKGKCHAIPIFKAFEQEEDFVRLDVKDLDNRYFKEFQ